MDPQLFPIIGNASAFAASGIALLARGLARSYKWFTIYLLGQALFGIGGVFLYRYRNLYGVYYFAVGLFSWIVPAFAAAEAFTQVMSNHPGVAKLGTKIISGCLLAAAAISTASVFLRTNPDLSALLRAGMTVERYVKFGILVFWILLIAFLVYFPVSLTRNTVVHCFAFAAYFFIGTTSAFVIPVLPERYRFSFLVTRSVLIFACAAAWTFLLTRRGESILVRIGHRWNPSEEAKLLAQLDSINSHLVSTSHVE